MAASGGMNEAMSTTRPDLYGLLGYPLGHTLSPPMHRAALAWADLPGTYVALPVPPERLDGAIEGVRAWRLPGLNVTVPHKTAVIPMLDGLTPQARAIGAVNTIYWEGDALWGDNTDYRGFLDSLPDMEWGDLEVTLLGAGGAARAVAAALADLGTPAVHLVARRLDQAAALRADLLPETPGLTIGFEDARLAECLAKSRLLVNSTPVGMDGAGSPLLERDLAQLPAGAVVYDLIYNPSETPLLAAARRRGLAVQNGLDMLVGQAVTAFERWTGRRPPPGLLRDAARRPD